MDLRELKALELAARSKIIFNLNRWLVPSQSGGTTYSVTLQPASCTCEDFQLRQLPCKHVIAARLVAECQGEGKAEVVVDVVPKKPTYRQQWPLYNQAQQTEKTRFQHMLFDLLRGVNEPPQPATGRRRTRMTDRVFASCLKVYTTFSSRCFACDLADAHRAGHLSKLMNSVSVTAYMEDEMMTPILSALVEQAAMPLKLIETTFAPDSSGFSSSRIHRWFDEKWGEQRSGRAWVKAHAIVGTKSNIITSVIVGEQHSADCPNFKPLVERTAENGFNVETICADKAYLSRENLELVNGMGGTAFIPFKSNSLPGEPGSVWEKMYGMFMLNRPKFLKHYHVRSNAETAFSMIKMKFRNHVLSKTDTAMRNEVLLKCLAHNLVVVHQAIIELGIEGTFWPNGTCNETPCNATKPVQK